MVDRSPKTPYFDFDDQENWPFYEPDRVLMFSGGLDSLAGIVETAARGGKAVLVSHRPVSTLYARQRTLFVELQKKFPGQLIHIPVWINKGEGPHLRLLRVPLLPQQKQASLNYPSLKNHQ